MKIGILTQPLHNNYGGLLQAYALQTALERLGHDSVVLDRYKETNYTLFAKAVQVAKYMIKRYVLNDKKRPVPFWPTPGELARISQYTSAFVEDHIKKTSVFCSTEALRKQARINDVDAFIVGSDQVWRPIYSPCHTNYFFDFIENEPSVLRIAYAAYFGVATWQFNPDLTARCAQLASKFNAISVREDSGVQLCKQYLGVDAVHMPDPTLLLDADDYSALALANNEPVLGKKGVCIIKKLIRQ